MSKAAAEKSGGSNGPAAYLSAEVLLMYWKLRPEAALRSLAALSSMSAGQTHMQTQFDHVKLLGPVGKTMLPGADIQRV